MFTDQSGTRQPNRRKVFELPWQLIRAGDYSSSEHLLESLEFLHCKAEANLVFDLVADHERLKATGHVLSEHLRRWAEIVRQESQVLYHWPTVTSQHIHNMCVFRGMQGDEAEAYRIMQSVGLAPLLAIESRRIIRSEPFTVRWLGRQERAVHCVAVCPDTQCCISGGYDGMLWVFPMLQAPLSIPLDFMIESVGFAPNYPHAVVAGRDGEIALIDLQSGDVHSLEQVPGRVREMKVAPSGVTAHVLHGAGSVSRLDLKSRSVSLCHTLEDRENHLAVVQESTIHEVPAPPGARPRLAQLPTTSPFAVTPEGNVLQLMDKRLESTSLSHRVGGSWVEGDPTGWFLGLLGRDQVLSVYLQVSASDWREVHRAVDVSCFAWGSHGVLAVGKFNGDVELYETPLPQPSKGPGTSDTVSFRIPISNPVPRVRAQLKGFQLRALVDDYSNTHPLGQGVRLAMAVPRYDVILWVDINRRLWATQWLEWDSRMSAPTDMGRTDGEVVYLADLPQSGLILLGYIDGRIQVAYYDNASQQLERYELEGYSSAVIRAAEVLCGQLVAVLYDRMVMLYDVRELAASAQPAVPCGFMPLPAIATTLAWDSEDDQDGSLLAGDEQSWWMRIHVKNTSIPFNKALQDEPGKYF